MDTDKIFAWFSSLDNERQNDLMQEADADAGDIKFYVYLNKHFAKAIKNFSE